MKKVFCVSNLGLNGHIVSVEIDSSKALPWIDIVGLPDNAVKESKERIRSCFKNSWLDLPNRRFIVNLSPSDLKKTWTRYDLAIATWIFCLINDIDLEKAIFLWELGLDGLVKPISWILPAVISAQKQWFTKFFVPDENVNELWYLKDIEIFWVKKFLDLTNHLEWKEKIFATKNFDINIQKTNPEVDFEDIRWQEFAKKALAVAACWMHNILMAWSPWAWKTLLAKALVWILPHLQFDEVLEISQIYSLAWKLNSQNPLITLRPFRSVHHTASKVSIIWGWSQLLPWEISLAHKWILFLDELTEFPKDVLDVLRQPIEDKKISISRASWNATYPSNFMLVAAMNPCKCWYYKDPIKNCTCSLNDIKKYQSRISWPMLDRFDMILEIPRENVDTILSSQKSQSSADILENIKVWLDRQVSRYKDENFFLNSYLDSKTIQKYIILDEETEIFFKQIIKSMNLSPRVIHRLLKLSRSVADYENSENIVSSHIAQALQYRSKHFLLNNE